MTQLGESNILRGCYTSNSFPTDPLCSLFTRAPADAANKFNILTIQNPYLNINQQLNKSLDFTTAVPSGPRPLGSLSLLGQATYQFKDKLHAVRGHHDDQQRQGRRSQVGCRLQPQLDQGAGHDHLWSEHHRRHQRLQGAGSLEEVGGANLTPDNCLATASAYALRGGPYCPVYKLPRVAYHSLSADIQATRDIDLPGRRCRTCSTRSRRCLDRRHADRRVRTGRDQRQLLRLSRPPRLLQHQGEAAEPVRPAAQSGSLGYGQEHGVGGRTLSSPLFCVVASRI